MIFFRYLTRLFWTRFFSIALGSILILMVFEWLTLSGPYTNILKKIPFSMHKLLPFITFITMLTFTWHLISHHEWNALSSIGRSPWNILRTPIIWASLLGLADLWFIVPMGQQFFNPFETGKSDISLISSKWKKGLTTDGYVFFNLTGPQKHVLEIDKNSILKQHIVARTLDIRKSDLICKDVWRFRAHHSPEKKPDARVVLLKPVLLDCKESHPLTLSLGQAYSAIQENPKGSALLSGRIHYWWSHFFWSISLVLLAPALLVGSSSRHEKIFGTIFGLLGVLMLYLVKEWLYALSIPLAHTWPIFLLWFPFFITSGLTLGLFFEKREL